MLISTYIAGMQMWLLTQRLCSKYTNCVLVYNVITPRALVVYKLLLRMVWGEGEEILNRNSRGLWVSELSWVLKEKIELVLGENFKNQGPYMGRK